MATLPAQLPALLGGTPMLQLLLGSYPLPVTPTWPALPVTNSIRLAFIAASTTSVDPFVIGFTITNIGQDTAFYNMVNGLDYDVRTQAPSPGQASLANIDVGLTYSYPAIPAALLELQKLGVPSYDTDMFLRILSSDSIIFRVSGVATLLTLAGTLILHPRIT